MTPSPVEGVLGRVLLGVLHTGADAVPRVQRTFPRGGVPVSEPFLAVSAGSGFDDGRLNAFLASALLRVARVVPIQAPASVSVVSSAAVRGSDAVVLEPQVYRNHPAPHPPLRAVALMMAV